MLSSIPFRLVFYFTVCTLYTAYKKGSIVVVGSCVARSRGTSVNLQISGRSENVRSPEVRRETRKGGRPGTRRASQGVIVGEPIPVGFQVRNQKLLSYPLDVGITSSP